MEKAMKGGGLTTQKPPGYATAYNVYLYITSVRQKITKCSFNTGL